MVALADVWVPGSGNRTGDTQSSPTSRWRARARLFRPPAPSTHEGGPLGHESFARAALVPLNSTLGGAAGAPNSDRGSLPLALFLRRGRAACRESRRDADAGRVRSRVASATTQSVTRRSDMPNGHTTDALLVHSWVSPLVLDSDNIFRADGERWPF